MGRREGSNPNQATGRRECGQWRGTSEFRVEVGGLPAALAAHLNQEPSLTPKPFSGLPRPWWLGRAAIRGGEAEHQGLRIEDSRTNQGPMLSLLVEAWFFSMTVVESKLNVPMA